MRRPARGRATRDARRRSRDGSGPETAGAARSAFPGATSWFALFGEVLLTGLLVSLASIPIITLPVGLAAGVRHLRRFARGEDSRAVLFWRDVRRGLWPGVLVGAAALCLAVVLVIDIDLGASGALPGGAVFVVVGWAGLALGTVVLLAAATTWTPEHGWRGGWRTGSAVVLRSPAAFAYYLAAGVFVVVVTWALPPLFIPAVGCAALACVAIPARVRLSLAARG